MITATLLSVLQFFIDFLVGLLPTDTTGFVPFITTGFTYIVSILWAFDFILPVHDILQVLQWSLLFAVGVLAFKTIEWIINKIPFIN